MFRSFLVVACLVGLTPLDGQPGNSSHIEEVKGNIIESLAPTLAGDSQPHPLLILLGGYVSSGKTTLSNAIRQAYGITVFSLNSIRQAMLDEGIDIRSNKQEERAVLFDLYPQLLAPCIANLQHIVIDANANRQGIEDALRFLKENVGGSEYRVVKIHLTASEDELFNRVRARVQQEGLHQGTEGDLVYELSTPAKAIFPEDYDLIIDTEFTAFEEEMEIVRSFLQPYFED